MHTLSVSSGTRILPPGRAADVTAPALLAAIGLHAVLLAVIVLAVGAYRLPEAAVSPVISLVFAPATDSPAAAPQVRMPDISPAEPPLAPVPGERDAVPVASPVAAPAPEPALAPEISQPVPSQPPVVLPLRISSTRSAVVARPSPTAPPRLKIQPQVARQAEQAAEAAAPYVPAGPPPAPIAAPINDGWRTALIGWLQTHKTYPAAARMAGAEGRVLVRFTAYRDGHVLDVALAQSSGSRPLDDAAIALLQGARLPAFPSGMTQDAVKLTLPLNYRLD